MTLLELECVSKLSSRGLSGRNVLCDVSMEIDSGEVVAVWGQRRSGRSTLLRVAAGVELPDAGVVRFDGHDLAAYNGALLGGGIGYCHESFPLAEGRLVVEQLVVGQLARGVSLSVAKLRARRALARVGAEHAELAPVRELRRDEAVRVAIARALAVQPRLLIVDEPTGGVDLQDRDKILLLLHSLANEGIAVLMSTDEGGTGLSGVDRAMSLSDGELRSGPTREIAPVVPLRQRRHASA